MMKLEGVVRRSALAAQTACVTSVALYAAYRVVQAARSASPSLGAAATIAAGEHAGYFWRFWSVSYAGVMLGFLAFAAASRHEARVARGLVGVLFVAIGLLVVQTIFVP